MLILLTSGCLGCFNEAGAMKPRKSSELVLTLLLNAQLQ